MRDESRSRASSGPSSGASTGTIASDPTTSPTRLGAAAPHFDRRVDRAAVTSGESAAIEPSIEHLFE